MNEWWESLSSVNRGFYMVATGFGVLFVWQLIASFIGLGGDDMDADMDSDVELDHDATYDDFEHGAEGDAIESLSSFKVLSVRSVITFFTLFTWGTALYLNNGLLLSKALMYGTAWGVVGMLIVAWLFYMLKKMSETGNINLSSCIGATGTVYINIPENGQGEIKVLVSKVSTHVKARGAGGKALDANTVVKVLKRIGEDVFEVDVIETDK
jgi:hypothetical protein